MPSASISGTIIGVTEALVRTGNIAGARPRIVITLEDTEWVAAGAAFDAQRQNIINGLVSGSGFINGWDAVVVPGFPLANVVRTSDTVVTITLPTRNSFTTETGAYIVNGSDETVSVTVPASAITTGAPLNAGSFVIEDLPFTFQPWFGDFPSSQTEVRDALRETGIANTIRIRIANARWVPLAEFDATRTAFINGLTSDQDEATGWNALVKPRFVADDVTRESIRDVHILTAGTADPNYFTESGELITFNVPLAAIHFDVASAPPGAAFSPPRQWLLL